MPEAAPSLPSIDAVRRHYVEQVLTNLQPLRDAVFNTAVELADQVAERAVAQQRRDMLQEMQTRLDHWLPSFEASFRAGLSPATAASTAAAALAAAMSNEAGLQLVDDATIQRNILVSRLALAILDKTTWEFADLRARLSQLSGQADLDDDDLLRPQVLARTAIKSWLGAELALESWRAVEPALHRAFSERVEAAFHETNRWLIERGVMAQVDLRQFIRRSDGRNTAAGAVEAVSSPTDEPAIGSSTASGGIPANQSTAGGGEAWSDTPLGANITRPMPSSLGMGRGAVDTAHGRAASLTLRPQGQVAYRTDPVPGVHGAPMAVSASGAAERSGVIVQGGDGSGSAAGVTGVMGGGVGAAVGGPGLGVLEEETRMMTRPGMVGMGGVGGLARGEVVLGRFSDMLEQHLPGFRVRSDGKAPSAQLSQAMAQVQQRQSVPGKSQDGVVVPAPTPARLVADLREGQQALKQAATTPEEKATVELVALLFQSILTDDRIPTTLRVWFARLQMPVLRVALAEPDFFSGADHPARRLIDRMGACVMGFEGDAELIGTPLEAEIRRVVQVVEAFPDTGRRVFQAVLAEFEKFLEKYLRDHSPSAKAGVSLAQQIEQRETLAIQYTIELRKMINELAVQEGVRDFLFHIWADVLATTAVRHGPQSQEVALVRDAAAELLWMASAKTTRSERAEVIRKVPALIGILRQGMSAAGLAAAKQDEAIQALRQALTAAFSARATSISDQQLAQLKERLAMIEELLPEDDIELDDSWVLDEANHQHEGIEVISEGGSLPGPSMLAAALELQLGSAFTLDYRGRHDTVRLIWQGMHKQLTLFSASSGRCVLFQKTRLAAFLQAGLLVPIEDESLTVTATRHAMRKIKADPARLAQ